MGLLRAAGGGGSGRSSVCVCVCVGGWGLSGCVGLPSHTYRTHITHAYTHTHNTRRREFNEWCTGKLNVQLSGEAGQAQVMGDLDIRGGDWNAQLKLGNSGFYGACVRARGARLCVCVCGRGGLHARPRRRAAS